MRHADEGLLHAWLDGALLGEEADTVRQHLSMCANCRTRLEEAARLRDQADAILAGAAPAELPRPPFAEVVAQAQALALEAHLPAPRLRLGQGGRSISWRTLGWAASILIAVGAGWWGHGLLRQPQRLAVREDGLTAQEKARAAQNHLLLRLETSPAVEPPELSAPAGLAAPGMTGAAAAGTATRPADFSARDAQAAVAQRQPPTLAPPPAGTAAARAGAPATAPSPSRLAERGYQSLRVPTVVPPDLPPPAARPASREADFTGEGVQGARAWGNERITRITAQNVEAAPTFTPYTVAPELRNREEVGRALERSYPALLREGGIGGATVVWTLIDEKGAVVRSQVRTSSGYPDLDRAALSVARVMRFSPGLNRDQAVKVWVQLPIVFKADPGAPYRSPEPTRVAAEAMRAPAAAPAAVPAQRADAPVDARAGGLQTQAGKAVAQTQGIDTTRRVALEAIVVAGYGAERGREARDARQALEARVQVGLPAAPLASAVLVEGLPVIRSLPRRTPAELSRVLQRLPTGDTIEVVAAMAALGLAQAPTEAARPEPPAAPSPWSGPARPGTTTVSTSPTLGTVVTITGVLPAQVLRPLLGRVRVPDSPRPKR